ncbi:DJ-1 family protein [Cardiosporidium cionae]|uniref:DJ-1 family protein n=1 Tax=Cardiosporidium cionae TaxID=476202 RepID=A0ABQ7J736_9APIC|nr:DJ-1 family protein [Cardiosporidium cionae]|eukprot:KAF8819807.1 DJ-1 family protein [Cardiosporidium cionae]
MMPVRPYPLSPIYFAWLLSFIVVLSKFLAFAINFIPLGKYCSSPLTCFGCATPATFFQRKFLLRSACKNSFSFKNCKNERTTHPISMADTKTVLVPIIENTEEIEAVTVIDTLVRAGAKVTVASCGTHKIIKMSRGVVMVADVFLEECKEEIFSLIVIPGGAGAKKMNQVPLLISLLQKQKREGRWFAAICAAPALVLEPHGLLGGETAVAYPANAHLLSNPGKGRVCISNHCVTSIGPGSALEFSLTLVEILFGKSVRQTHSEAMCVHPALYNEEN